MAPSLQGPGPHLTAAIFLFIILVVIRATPQLPLDYLPQCCPEPLNSQAIALWFIISIPLQHIIIQYKLWAQQLKGLSRVISMNCSEPAVLSYR